MFVAPIGFIIARSRNKLCDQFTDLFRAFLLRHVATMLKVNVLPAPFEHNLGGLNQFALDDQVMIASNENGGCLAFADKIEVVMSAEERINRQPA